MLLYAGIASLCSFKYSGLNATVKKLKQWSLSAGSPQIFRILMVTSETLRNSAESISENIKNISIHVPTHLRPLNDTQLGHYLAGLIDGDGHFSSKQQLVIVFDSRDVKLAYYLKEVLGNGRVKKVKDKNAYLLIISNKNGILRVLNLINGKLRIINKFNQVINNILTNSKYSEESISFSMNKTNDFNNHWIAGFSDAALTTQSLVAPKSSNTKNLNKKPVPQSSQVTSLTVFGQNLTSSVGKGRFTKQESNMIQLTPFHKSVVIGLLLSDGWLTRASVTNKNIRLGLKQSLSHSLYLWFVFLLLSHYCSSYPSFISFKTKETSTYALQFFTRSLPCFTEIYSLFYVEGKKIIPENIYNLLTPVALAHLIMGDGNADKHGLILCTDSYSIEDVVRLMNVLIIKYRLNCSIFIKASKYPSPKGWAQPEGQASPRIYIKSESMPVLRAIVGPFMSTGMLYKLGELKTKPVSLPR